MAQPSLRSALTPIFFEGGGAETTSVNVSITITEAGDSIVFPALWYRYDTTNVNILSIVRNGQSFVAPGAKVTTNLATAEHNQEWVLIDADVGTYDAVVSFGVSTPGDVFTRSYCFTPEIWEGVVSVEGYVTGEPSSSPVTITPSTATNDLKVIHAGIVYASNDVANITPTSPTVAQSETNNIFFENATFASYSRPCSASGQTLNYTSSGSPGSYYSCMLVGASGGGPNESGSYSSAFSVKNFVDAAFSSSFSVRNYVSVTYSSGFTVKNYESGAYVSAFTVKNYVDGSYDSAFAVKNYVSATYASSFSVDGVVIVSGTFSGGFSVKNYVGKTFDSAFTVRNYASANYETGFSVKNFVNGSYAGAFTVLNYSTGNYQSAFAVKNYVSATYSSGFTVEGGSIVTGSFSSGFTVKNYVSATYTSGFYVNFSEGRLKQAIKEAYASAPSGVYIIHTLEFRHPNFKDENNTTTSIKVVLGHKNIEARLEDTAPLKPGQYVTFIPMAFELDLPNIEHLAMPEIAISIDNVTREIEDNLMIASASPFPVEVTYRPYLNTDLTNPQMDPPLTLTIISAEADDFSVKARATYGNAANVLVPRETYVPERFPGMQR